MPRLSPVMADHVPAMVREMSSYDSGGSDYTDGGQRMPATQTTLFDYNHGMAWTTTAIPPALVNANLDMAGSLAMQPCPVPSSPTPSQLPGMSLSAASEADTVGQVHSSPGVHNLCTEGARHLQLHCTAGPQVSLEPDVIHGRPSTFKSIYHLGTHLAKSCKRPAGKPEEDFYVLAERAWAAAEGA
ncbi:hypothetical protein JB92DRAFT_3139473 [Gautieria morchelliformis]|nr:hypothetical protein JB92DRAFT_3139473 [Gautieria morchelliformis]